MDGNITIAACGDEAAFVREVRVNGLLRENMRKTHEKLNIPDVTITRVAYDRDGGIVGGIQGSTYLSSLEIDVLWVEESYRGQGIASRMLCQVEEEAGKHGCRLAHLTTYSFQAPGFYCKQGYHICGEIDGFPDDIKLFILKKQLPHPQKAGG